MPFGLLVGDERLPEELAHLAVDLPRPKLLLSRKIWSRVLVSSS
jgi:hypothetical protein